MANPAEFQRHMMSSLHRTYLKDPVMSIMLHAPLLLFWFARGEASTIFRDFAFLAANTHVFARGKELYRLPLLFYTNLFY